VTLGQVLCIRELQVLLKGEMPALVGGLVPSHHMGQTLLTVEGFQAPSGE
jgi:hypothetical protein